MAQLNTFSCFFLRHCTLQFNAFCMWVYSSDAHCFVVLQHYGYCSHEHRRVIHTGRRMKSECFVIFCHKVKCTVMNSWICYQSQTVSFDNLYHFFVHKIHTTRMLPWVKLWPQLPVLLFYIVKSNHCLHATTFTADWKYVIANLMKNICSHLLSSN